VKFAKYEPGEPELRDLHGSAVRLVEETEQVEVSGLQSGVSSPESAVQSSHSTPVPAESDYASRSTQQKAVNIQAPIANSQAAGDNPEEVVNRKS
jgi:hypothetical protein